MVTLKVEGDKIFHPKPLLQARIIDRPNRFIVNAEVNGKSVRCHCPSTGRIGGYKLDGLPCLLSGPHDLTKRSTEYTMEAFSVVEVQDETFQWVGINQTAMNSYVKAAMTAGFLSEAFGELQPEDIRSEVKLGASRMDFFLRNKTWVEVKMPLTILEIESDLTPKDFTPKIGIDRMLKQLDDITEAMNAGQEAVLLTTFAYTMPKGTVPGATSRKKFGPLPAMAAAMDAGLDRWQLNLRFYSTHVEIDRFAKLVLPR